MIKVNRLNETELWISANQVEFVEETPDTVISLVSGRKIIVSQSVNEIIEQIIAYHKRIIRAPDIAMTNRKED